MATTIPSVDFGFDELRSQMNAFTLKFDQFIEKRRKQLLDDKSIFSKEMVHDKESQRARKSDLENSRIKEQEIRLKEDKDRQEVEETENSISEMEKKREHKQAHEESLISQVHKMKDLISKRRAARAAERNALSMQASRNAPELEFWEQYLGMQVVSSGVADLLKVVFTHLVDTDWTQEAWFLVNMQSREYEVTDCHPKLATQELERVVNRLNESREFNRFLKDIRELLKARMNLVE